MEGEGIWIYVSLNIQIDGITTCWQQEEEENKQSLGFGYEKFGELTGYSNECAE